MSAFLIKKTRKIEIKKIKIAAVEHDLYNNFDIFPFTQSPIDGGRQRENSDQFSFGNYAEENA